MTEMWLTPETYYRLKDEAKSICTEKGESTGVTTMCGVELRCIDDAV